MKTMIVLAEYITAGPIIVRTAFRSLVARDIRSPGAAGLVVAEGHLLEAGEEVVPDVVLDVARGADDHAAHQVPEHCADARHGEDDPGVAKQFADGHTGGQIVDRVFQHPRRQQLDGAGDENEQQSECELTTVVEGRMAAVGETRGPSSSSICAILKPAFPAAAPFPRSRVPLSTFGVRDEPCAFA